MIFGCFINMLLEGAENQENLKTLEDIAMQDPVLHQAIAAWEKTSDDPQVREEYFARRKAVTEEEVKVLKDWNRSSKSDILLNAA